MATKKTKKRAATFTGPLAPLERALNGIFGENAPFQLPKNGKVMLVKIAPWLALVSGVFGLLAAIGLWRISRISEWSSYIDRISTTYTGTSQKLGIFFWFSFVALTACALLALAAISGLKARSKTGWNLMFYSATANVVYGFGSLFYMTTGAGSFFGTILTTVIGLYLLFQVRSYYS